MGRSWAPGAESGPQRSAERSGPRGPGRRRGARRRDAARAHERARPRAAPGPGSLPPRRPAPPSRPLASQRAQPVFSPGRALLPLTLPGHQRRRRRDRAADLHASRTVLGTHRAARSPTSFGAPPEAELAARRPAARRRGGPLPVGSHLCCGRRAGSHAGGPLPVGSHLCRGSRLRDGKWSER